MANEEASAGRLWASFNSKGEVRDTESSEVESKPGQSLAAALCVKVREGERGEKRRSSSYSHNSYGYFSFLKKS